MKQVKYEYVIVNGDKVLKENIRTRENAREFKRHWKKAIKDVKIVKRVWEVTIQQEIR